MRIRLNGRQGGNIVAAACAVAEEKNVLMIVRDEEAKLEIREDIIRALRHIGLSGKNAVALVNDYLEIRVPDSKAMGSMSHWIIPDEI